VAWEKPKKRYLTGEQIKPAQPAKHTPQRTRENEKQTVRERGDMKNHVKKNSLSHQRTLERLDPGSGCRNVLGKAQHQRGGPRSVDGFRSGDLKEPPKGPLIGTLRRAHARPRGSKKSHARNFNKVLGGRGGEGDLRGVANRHENAEIKKAKCRRPAVQRKEEKHRAHKKKEGAPAIQQPSSHETARGAEKCKLGQEKIPETERKRVEDSVGARTKYKPGGLDKAPSKAHTGRTWA